MIQRAKVQLIATMAVLLALPFIPQQAEAQDGARFRVLVADLKPTDGTRDRFGDRTSSEVRDLIDLPTHVALSSRDADQAAREYDLRLRDLDCITAQQLASQLEIPLVMCGEYEEVNGQIRYNARFITVPAGEEFPVESQTLPEGEHRAAAAHILESFQSTIEQVQFISWCGSEYNSSNWEDALEYCSRAVDLVPESVEARFALARTLMELEEYEQSLGHFRTLVEEDPTSSSYLENAGWVAAQLDEIDEARDYYNRFLELNPENVSVRLRVAYDLAQAGDAYGAMGLVEEGFEHDPDNVDLHEQYGSYAFRAALDLQAARPRAQQDGDEPGLDPEVAEMFRLAIASLERVLEAREGESRPQYVINSMRAYIQLEEPDEAAAFGERALEWFPENAQIRSQLASAYSRAGMVDEAVDALSEALELDPDLSNARARMASYYLDAGRIDDAVDAIVAAAEAGEQSPDALGGILLSYGFSEGVQAGDFDLGIRLFEAVSEMDGLSDEFRSQTSFFHGYALYEQGRALEQPQTVASAERTLPIFRRALEHLERGQLYAQENPGSNLNQIIEAANQFIEIQDAIIRRGNR